MGFAGKGPSAGCTPGPQEGSFTGRPVPPRLPQRLLQMMEGLSTSTLPRGISRPPELAAELSPGPFAPASPLSRPYPLLPQY